MALDDDDFGSADDLDDLPEEAVREIETQAYASTQQRRLSNAPSAADAYEHQAPPQADPPPSEYDFPDANDIQLDGQPLLAKLPQTNVTGPPQRFGGNTVRNNAITRRTAQDLAADRREPLYEHRLNRHARNSNYDLAAPSVQQSLAADDCADASIEELRTKIDELRNEIDNATRAKNEALAQVQRKAGEASILRMKLQKADKEHMNALASKKKANTERAAALEAQIAALKRELDKTKSEYKFLEQDFKTETGKPKSRRNLKDGTVNGNARKAQETTPKRTRRAEFGDGFDDGGVMEVSPSKSRDKSRNGTPKQGAKRKRNALEASPAKPLPLAEPQPPQVPEDDGLVAMQDVEPEDDLLANVSKTDKKFKYHPLHIILDTLQFVLSFESLEKTASLAEEIVPLVQSSASLVVWTSLDNPELKQHIDLHECLRLMITVSRSCVHDTEATTRFWSLVSRDFIRALLKSPLLSTLSLTVQLLATSITPTTFGPIPDFDPAELPSDRIKDITVTDHLTSLLQDTPSLVPSQQPARWSFRLTLLHTFAACLHSPAAAAALATHKYFLGRLLLLLNDAVATLYATAPRTPLAATLAAIANVGTRVAFVLATDPATRKLVDRPARLKAVQGANHAHLVALTRLAFSDVDDDGEEEEDGGDGDDVGGVGGFGFGGARVLEAGIEEEVVDMAHQLLDEYLSPQEGEELVRVFSSGRSIA
ncbi:putative dna repair protein rad26 protein [Lasiodiplodia theobromae]|nr:putative dna repair protein rad26 protein [Lasiodiplodia theobromae]